jgi:hypothetical protein
MNFYIGFRVIVDKGESTELSGCIVGESTVYSTRTETPQKMFIVELDEGGYLRPPMAKVDEIKGYVSLLVVHADNLTLEPE